MSFNLMQTQGQILNRVQVTLQALQNALVEAQKLYAWTSGLDLADLEAMGFDPADAQAILTAAADANGLATLYNNGTVSQSLPYNFASSQRAVIGPP